MRFLLRLARQIPLVILSPIILLASAAAFALEDLAWKIFGRSRRPDDVTPANVAASVVIPNWNGRDLLEKYLSSVIAALAGNSANEVIVVDNGSSDGSAEFIRQQFPDVKLVALERNLGFGGGSNAGVRAAVNDIVVLLNSDMRVEAGFLGPLLSGFSGANVFAVSCQILFTDPAKRREETGLTQGWWEEGGLRVRHRIDEQIRDLYPCFYGGGGSCAFDRRKFLELGGFDRVLEPFYLEDTDLGYQAWKRGWKVLVPTAERGVSRASWDDRQTVHGRADSSRPQQEFHFVCVEEHPRVAPAFITLLFHLRGRAGECGVRRFTRRASMSGMGRAFLQLPGAMRSRWRARSLAVVSDTEAFHRPLGGYFRDRFATMEADPEKLRVLFVSPYPICPPIHGGGVFMFGTLRELGKVAEVHVIAFLESAEQREAHDELRGFCASVELPVRPARLPDTSADIAPHAVREFADADLEWLIHRQIYLSKHRRAAARVHAAHAICGPFRPAGERGFRA